MGIRVAVGIAVFFVVLKSRTDGESVTDRLSIAAAETRTEILGFVAYRVLFLALLATVGAVSRLPATVDAT